MNSLLEDSSLVCATDDETFVSRPPPFKSVRLFYLTVCPVSPVKLNLALNGYSNAQPAETMAHNLAAAAVGISPTAYARPNHAQDEPLAQNLIIGVL